MWSGQIITENDVLKVFEDIPSDPESVDGLDDKDVLEGDFVIEIGDINDINIEDFPIYLEDELGCRQEISCENFVRLNGTVSNDNHINNHENVDNSRPNDVNVNLDHIDIDT